MTTLNQSEYLINQLYDNNLIQKGLFTLKSGEISTFYIDIRKAMSFPLLLENIGEKIFNKINEKYKGNFSNIVICGVPYGGLPLAFQVGITHFIPMVIKRKEKKDHGNKNLIEGEYIGKKCILIEDVVTTGSSLLETIADIENEGLIVDLVISFIDRRNSKTNIFGKEYKYILDLDDILLCNYNRYRLLKIVQEKGSNICFSADITDKSELLKMIQKVGPHVCTIKIHSDIIKNFDDIFIQNLLNLSKKYNFLIIEDRKLADIGNTMVNQLENLGWADMVTIHGISGEKAITSLKNICQKLDISLLLIAEMSCEGNLIENKYTKSIVNIADKHQELVTGFISQKILHPRLLHFTPGVKLNDSTDSKGQKYRYPINIETDIYIIGRGIYECDNPEEEVKKYKQICYKYLQ